VQRDPGYAILEGIFDRVEMSRSIEALASAAVPRVRAGARHVLGLPEVRAIAEDGRLTRIAARFVGVSPAPFRATLLDKSQHANWLVAWHQDTMLPVRRRVDDPAWGSWSVKGGVLCGRAPAAVLETVVALRVHLDDSTDANGPLRVLPGTHTRGILTADAIARATREIVPVACAAACGGVVAMRPLTIHSSAKSRDAQPRRVLHIEYAACIDLNDGAELFDGRGAA
jgi:phytanoyl-CoA dioxygenase PhyH